MGEVFPPEYVPAAVREAYAELRAGATFQFLGNNGGFSGTRLWRVETPKGMLCLRAWPKNVPAPQVEIIHLRLEDAGRAKLAFVPRVIRPRRLPSYVSAEGLLWELTTWMPGVADFHCSPTLSRLGATGTALAKLHLGWQGTAMGLAPCPAVRKRLSRLAIWTEGSLRQVNEFLAGSPNPALAFWAGRAFECVQRWLTPARLALAPWERRPLPIQFCLCDIWHDHVLFTGDEVSGIVDFGSVDQDNVAADLARLLGSFIGDDAEMRSAALESYRAIRLLAREEEELIPVLDWTGIVVGAGNWLRWLYFDERHYENLSAVARRLETLVLRMESWKQRPA